MAALELRPGARIGVRRTNGEWQEAKLIRPSPNDEEWLLEDRVGRFWVHVSRLRPAREPRPEQEPR